MTKFESNLSAVVEELQNKDVLQDAKDVDLQKQINNEVIARTDANVQLQTNIDNANYSREVIDKSLQEQIINEGTSRTESDKTLQANIDAEINARTKADQGLQDQITTEITARTNADKLSQSSIDVETNARTVADKDLQDQINKEVAVRTEADKQLQANIDNAKTEANSYTDTKVANVVNGAPGALDTLKELADALNEDSNFATTVTNQLAQKADKSQIPNSLPANGGNADTVDGKHAVDFAPAGYIPPNATETMDGSMSAADKAKLDGVEAGAQVNQNAFSNVVVNGTTIHADSQTDTLELLAGTNIALIADATNENVTIAVTGKVASAAQADSATTATTADSATTAASCTGNAATATKLATARSINGVAFDGSADIAITAESDYDGGHLLSTNGYQKLSNGLILQWGQVQLGDDGVGTFSFPIPFPALCFGVYCTGSSLRVGGSAYTGDTQARIISTSQFKISNDGWSNIIYWFAIGY